MIKQLRPYLLFLCLSSLSGFAMAGKEVSHPGATGHAKLDAFVNSSFNLYKKNASLFEEIDGIGALSAMIMADPQGFASTTASGSLDDAISTAKDSSSRKVQNWDKTLQNKSVSDALDGVSDDSKAALLSRVQQLGTRITSNQTEAQTKNVGAEAGTLLGKAKSLLGDMPKNPFKAKDYIKALNASKSVLKKMSVEYPEKLGVLSQFLAQ